MSLSLMLHLCSNAIHFSLMNFSYLLMCNECLSLPDIVADMMNLNRHDMKMINYTKIDFMRYQRIQKVLYDLYV